MRNQKSFTELTKDHKDRFEKEFKKDFANLDPTRQKVIRKMSDEVDQELDIINSEYDEGVEIENRFRKAGYLPSQAHELIKESKNKDIGMVFKFFGKEIEDNKILYTAFDKYFVKTPFNTVVQADEYIKALQDQLLVLAKLNEEFTSQSIFGLIKLAFKRTFTNLFKGKNNG